MTNREVKEYLMRYRDAKREQQDVDLRIAELRTKYASPAAIRYSDMPTAHNADHDLSNYYAALEQLQNMLIDKVTRCIGIEVDIETRLDRMDDQIEREILRHRYCDVDSRGRLQSWESIAETLGYSRRAVTNIHGRALSHFPTDDLRW